MKRIFIICTLLFTKEAYYWGGKSTRMRCGKHVTRMGETKNAYIFFTGKTGL